MNYLQSECGFDVSSAHVCVIAMLIPFPQEVS